MTPESLVFDEWKEAALDEATKLKPRLDFIIMRIIYRLQKTGKDIKIIFDNLDSRKEGQIENEVLI